MLRLPPTTSKVRLNTNSNINARISEATKTNILMHQKFGKRAVENRITELNNEWDTERTLETSFGLLVLLSCVLGLTVNKKWFALGGIAGLFMAQHALQGWCPPLPVIRQLGVRSADEINEERTALLAVRNAYDQDI